MALTRKMLQTYGLEADKIDEVIQAHTETVNALKDEIDKEKSRADKLQEEASKAAGLEQKVKDLEKEVETLTKNSEGKDYDALKKEYDDYKAEVAKQALHSKKEDAYKELLKDAGIPEKHFAKILKYSNVDGVELDEKGKITTAKEIMKEIKEEWGDHRETTTQGGANTPTPPKSTGGSLTVEQIDAIKDTGERQAAIARNHELFGF